MVLETASVQKSSQETVVMNQFTDYDSRPNNSGFLPNWDNDSQRVPESDRLNSHLDYILQDIQDIDESSFDQYFPHQVSQGDSVVHHNILKPSLFNDWGGNSGQNRKHTYGNDRQNYHNNMDHRSSSASSNYHGSPSLPLYGTVSSASSSPYSESLSPLQEEASVSPCNFQQYETHDRTQARGWPRVVNKNNDFNFRYSSLTVVSNIIYSESIIAKKNILEMFVMPTC